MAANSATGEKVFGSGYFWAVSNAANSTPVNFLALQNMSVDFKRDIKYLHGVNQLPIEVASGKLTVSGKAELATLNGRLINDMILGTSLASGQQPWVVGEAGTVTNNAGTYQVIPANMTNFVQDLGVIYTSGSNAFQPLVRTGTNPPASTGQYFVLTSGTKKYIFNSGDVGAAVAISYEYTDSTAGQNISVTNQPMGKATNFAATMGCFFGTEKATFQFNNVSAGGWNLATKLDDFAMSTFDFGCGTDSTGVLGVVSFAEVN